MTVRKRMGIVCLFFLLGAFTGAPASAQDVQMELMRSEWPLFRQAGGEWVVLGEALVANPAAERDSAASRWRCLTPAAPSSRHGHMSRPILTR